MSIEIIRFLFALGISCLVWFIIDLILDKKGK